MDVKLKVVDGSRAGQIVKITGKNFSIGRAVNCHLRPKSTLVGRHHCSLMIDETEVAVEDSGTRYGTFVNGDRVSGHRILNAGDQLQVGPLRFEILINCPNHGDQSTLKPQKTVKSALAKAEQTLKAATERFPIETMVFPLRA